MQPRFHTPIFLPMRFGFLLGLIIPVTAAAQPLTVEKIMQDPKTWIGAWPSDPFWSERGDTLFFSWNPGGKFPSDSLFALPRTWGEPRQVSKRIAPRFDGWHHQEGVYDAPLRRKVYEEGGDLYVYERATGARTRLTHTREREASPRFVPGGIVYRSGNNLFLIREDGGREQLTDLRAGSESAEPKGDSLLLKQQIALFETLRRRKEKKEAEKNEKDLWPPVYYFGQKTLEQVSVDPALHYAAFVLSPANEARKTLVPTYVTESGYVETESSRAKVGSPPSSEELLIQDLVRDTTYRVDARPLIGDSTRTHYVYGPYWSDRFAVVEVRTWDNKDRWIARLEPASGSLTALDHQHDEAWIQAPGISSQGGRSTMGWLPDGSTFFFQSEAMGRSHLYTADLVTGAVKQLTSGNFDVYDPMVSRDGRTWFFTSSEASPFERHLYKMPISGGERTRLTKLPALNETILNPDEKSTATLHSTTTRPPEIYLGEKAVTHSTTDAWNAYPWRDPKTVEIPASDGVQVPAHLFLPEKPNGGAVLFVHGAGYLQNVHGGWSENYYREYMFHNLLADEGYVVMNVDFRGSAGYGRDWRTAVYRHMGGRDLQDYVDASRYLGDRYGIDPERVFIYGGSYGGFITLMALFTEPEHFGGGAALRAVTDWAHYHYGYTANILNTPAEDSIAFRQSSPIYFADGLEDPLLIAHGLMDDNVHFQDVVRLVQRLIELGKEDWELAVYPLERHGFVEPESWTDEYRRVLKYIRLSVGSHDEQIPEQR